MHLDEYVGAHLTQRLLGFRPHPLGHQCVGFAIRDHAAHEFQRLVGDAEAQRRVTRGEARHAQDAYRVFGKRGRHVPQQARVEIAQTPVRIDHLAGIVLRHGIDGEVAAPEVVLEFDVRRELGGEAAVARAHLALGARQRVFFLGLGMQEYREIAAHGNVSGAFELSRRGAHDHPVPLGHLATEQAIPDRAAHQVHLHGRMLPTFRISLVIAAACLLAGCGTLYVAQAARGQLQILNARKPIARVIANPDTDADLRKRLEEVRLARDFASRELGLPNNKSYTSYADLKREFVTWTVVATPEFSVEPREWCFPIVGCVSYRGYFRKASAEKYAATLEAEGLDVMVGGVPAYSTLGKFNDPILNTMMSYGDDELASIIFHELSHQVVVRRGRYHVQRVLRGGRRAGRSRALAQVPRPGKRLRSVPETPGAPGRKPRVGGALSPRAHAGVSGAGPG